MDHDALFKTLLTTFFGEFIEGFLPDVAREIDLASIAFQPQEILTDLSAGERYIVDLVVKVRLRGKEVFFLIHVENQSRTEADFAFRMFKYAALLHIKYHLPVYSIVIYSHDTPKRPEPDHYEVALFGQTVLRFQYKVIQLNRLSWRDFLKQPNPVAAALMAKMQVPPQDRVKVQIEAMRMIRTLQLDPARSKLIGGFVNAYLRLNAEEMKQYERELAQLPPEEQEAAMNMVTTWERDGKESLVDRLIKRRFGSDAPPVTERLHQFSSDQLDELGEALFDFNSPADLEAWLTRIENMPERVVPAGVA